MNITDILKAFRPDADHERHADWETLCEREMSHYSYCYDYDKFSAGVKEYYVYSWICTDTRVGLSVITLHGSTIAIAKQTARKSDKQVEYLSEGSYNQLRNFMHSCVIEDTSYSVIDFEEDFDLTPGVDIEIRHLNMEILK